MNILSMITNNNLTDIFLVSVSLLVLVLTLLQIVFFKKIPFISLPLLLVLIALSIVFDNKVIYIILDVFYAFNIAVAIYEYINNYNETLKRDKRYFLKKYNL